MQSPCEFPSAKEQTVPASVTALSFSLPPTVCQLPVCQDRTGTAGQRRAQQGRAQLILSNCYVSVLP